MTFEEFIGSLRDEPAGGGRHVVCRGFHDAYPDNSAAAQVAGRLGLVRYVPVPGEDP